MTIDMYRTVGGGRRIAFLGHSLADTIDGAGAWGGRGKRTRRAKPEYEDTNLKMEDDEPKLLVVHKGGCHCRQVRWEVKAADSVVAWNCNCSDCSMRGNTHFIVPSERFHLIGDSQQFLTTYTFGTHTAKRTFCKVCGITSFYTPRSNPDGIAVTFRCVDPGTLAHVEINNFDGNNWEGSYVKTGIASCSSVNP